MGNKLVLIQEVPFGDPIKIIANNAKDLEDFLIEHHATEIKIGSDYWINFKLDHYILSSQLHWVKEI